MPCVTTSIWGLVEELVDTRMWRPLVDWVSPMNEVELWVYMNGSKVHL